MGRYENNQNFFGFKIFNKILSLVLYLILLNLIFGLFNFGHNKIEAQINNSINFQSKIVQKTSGLNVVAGTPACVSATLGTDTCIFVVRIWDVSSGGSRTNITGNLMYEELFSAVQLGANNGIFNLTINSICNASQLNNNHWGSTAASNTVCSLQQDSLGSGNGVSFDRADLWLEVAFDPAGTNSTLSSFNAASGIETFSRTNLRSVPSAFVAQTLSGIGANGFVQFAPSSTQTTALTNSLINLTTTSTSSTNPLLVINNTGSGTSDFLNFQVSGVNKLQVTNGGYLGIGANLVSGSDLSITNNIAANKGLLIKANAAQSGNLLEIDNSSSTALSYFNANGELTLNPQLRTSGTDTGSFVINAAANTGLTAATEQSDFVLNLNRTVQFNAGSINTQRAVIINAPTYSFTSASNITNAATLVISGSPIAGANATIGNSYALWVTNANNASNQSRFDGDIVSGVKSTGINTTTTGSGSASGTTSALSVTSTTGFNVGNLILVNAASWERVISVDSLTQMTVTPSLSWSAAQSVGAYTTSNIGHSTQQYNDFSMGYFLNGISTGTQNTGSTINANTTYQDQSINSTNALAINATNGSTNIAASGNINLSSNGLIINKNLSSNSSPSWSSGTSGGPSAFGSTSLEYNNKMYVYGGFNGFIYLNTMNIYDFTTNTWSKETSGGTARIYHTAVVYNGKMYAWGGTTDGYFSEAINTLDIYDFTTNTWSIGTPGGTPRVASTALVYNNKMYVYSGNIADGSRVNVMEIYDFTTGTWSTGIAGGINKTQSTAVIYNNKMYVWGGNNGSILNTMDVYDFTTSTWNTGVAGGTARNDHTAVVYNNKMYVWGGYNSTMYLNTMDIYDFGTNTWSIGTAGGTPRSSHTAVLYNNKMYEWGGLHSGSYLNTMDIYDFGSNDKVIQINEGGNQQITLDTSNVLTVNGPALGLRYVTNDATQYTTQGWSIGATGGTPRYSSVVGYNNKMYVWGGTSGGGFSNTMDIYDFITNKWSTGVAGGTPRIDCTTTVYNGKMYVWGGFFSGSFLNTMDIYDFDAGTWSVGTAGGTARSLHTGVIYNGKWYNYGGAIALNTYTNTMDVYDFATNTWSVGKVGITSRTGHVAVVYNGKMYTWSDASNINTMDVYDFAINSWSVGTAGGRTRYLSDAVVYNGRMYVWGGYNNNTSTYLNTMDVYDFTTNTWSLGITGGTAREVHNSAVVYNGRWYNYGGVTGGGVNLNTLDIYDFGASKSSDVFYIGNAQNGGPDDGKLFRFDATGRAYTSKQGGWFSVGADYAEYMYTNDTTISKAELVTLDTTNKGSIQRSQKARDPNVVGIISSDPGFVGNIHSIDDLNSTNGNWKLLSMVGQVPTKVDTEAGEIKIGDKLTSSSTPGVAMRADETDPQIGIAEEGFNGIGIGKIDVLVTRNNSSGTTNKDLKQITLGSNGAGIRISEEGKIQYKNELGEWFNLDSLNTLTNSTTLALQVAKDKITNQITNNNIVINTTTNIQANNKPLSYAQVAGINTTNSSSSSSTQASSENSSNTQTSSSSSVSTSTIIAGLQWIEEGDKVFLNNSSSNIDLKSKKVILGLDNTTAVTSQLNISKDLEVREGLKYLKISSEGTITIGGYANEIGIRVNPQTQELEYKDGSLKQWNSMDGVIISNTRVDNTTVSKVSNQHQITGWSFIKGDNSSSQLNSTITMHSEFSMVPILRVMKSGMSDSKPNTLSDCSSLNNLSMNQYIKDNNSFEIQFASTDSSKLLNNKYYCYSWIAIGN